MSKQQDVWQEGEGYSVRSKSIIAVIIVRINRL